MARPPTGYAGGVPTEGSRTAEEPKVVSTAPEDVDMGRVRRARAMRRSFLVVLAAFLLLGALGFLGVRSRSVSASGGGYDLEVTYGAVSRPGLATPWSVEVSREGGFEGPVTVATTAAYFDLFDENSLDPEPTSSTTVGDQLVWEFDPPPGDTLSISLDARIEPGVQRGREGTTSVLDGGRPVATVRYRTRVLP